MRKLLVLMITLGLLVFPSVNYGQSGQAASGVPPIAQPLVREGDFALRLAEVLELGSPTSEPEAESMLSAVGIAPENGWIADYPMTPDAVSELRSAVSEAADSDRLLLTRDEALAAFETLTEELGLGVACETSEEDESGEPPGEYPDYVTPRVVNNYYYNHGPPVLTYYLPPPSYYYLYSWVPYPFWYSGFFFGGYFILRDFNKVIVVDRGVAVVSNHVFHPKRRTHFALDPHKRFNRHRGVSSFRTGEKIHQHRGFRSPEDRRGAQSILNRSHRRHPTQPGGFTRPRGSFKPTGTVGRGTRAGMLSSESGDRGRERGTARALDRRQRSERRSTIDRSRNLGAHHENAQIRGGRAERRHFQPQQRSGTRRALNASPRGRPTRSFQARSSRGAREFSRGSEDQSRRSRFSARGGRGGG